MPSTPPMTMWTRGLEDDVSGVKTTFSSWDACMSETYCKWPVIIGIVVVSLIILSIVSCLVRCLCCGMECCCACFKCCNACCPSPRGGGNKSSKYADPPQGPPQGYQGGYQPQYQPQAPPIYAPPINRTFNPGVNPQFAQFDAGKKSSAVHEDSLPAMPSWETAQSKRVIDDTPEEVEMDHLNPADEQKAPMLAHQAPSPHGDHFDGAAGAPYQDRAVRNGGDLGNPYGPEGSQYGHDGAHSPYGAGAAMAGGASSYGRPEPTHQPGYSDSGYGRSDISPQQGHGAAAPYGAAVGGMNQQRSPSAGPYGQQRSPSAGPYGQQRSPSAGPYGQQPLQHQQSFDQTSYGVAPTRGPASPPGQTPYSPPQQAYGQMSPPPAHQAYGHVSPPPQQSYRAMSPPAPSSAVPTSLMPARGNTPQAPQQAGGYQGYSPRGQQQQQQQQQQQGGFSAYSGSTAYEPSHRDV